jgi:putative transcriptional regulator
MADNIRNRIKEYRLRRDLTQDELAKAVGVSRQSINAIERERYVPSLPLAIRFARFFNCPMEELFQLQEEA